MFKHFSLAMLAACTLVQATSAASPLPYDRVVIFGDSLSDTGNFPQIPNYQTTNAIDKIPYNLYIPISNPVNNDLYGHSFTIQQTKSTWQYPTLNFLKEASSTQGLINSQKKAFYSTTWSEYFIFNALKTQQLLPSSKIFSDTAAPAKTISLNYAWAGAMTINGFSNDNYAPMPGEYKGCATLVIDLAPPWAKSTRLTRRYYCPCRPRHLLYVYFAHFEQALK